MKTLFTLGGLVALATTVAFLTQPAVAEDEPAPPPQAGDEAPATRPDAPAPHFAGADRNRDGTIDAAEFKAFLARLEARFAELDADGDGALSKEERPQRRGRRGPRGMRGGPDARHQGPRRGMRQDMRRHAGRGMAPPHGRRGPRGGPDARGPRGGPQGLAGHGPQGMGPRGMGPRGMGPRGMGPQGMGPDGRRPGGRGGDAGPRDGRPGRADELGAKLDRLTATLERLLERMEQHEGR